MNLNQKVNSILALLLIMISFSGVVAYLLFGYQLNLAKQFAESPQVSFSNFAHTINKEEKGINWLQFLDCFNGGGILTRNSSDIAFDDSVLKIMGGQLFKEGYCKGQGFVFGHAMARWEDSLIYTYLESTEGNCFGDCPAESLIRKVELLDLASGEKNVLWSGIMKFEKEGKVVDITNWAAKHFYIINNNLYLNIGKDCSEGCSGSWNTGVTFRLSLDNPQEMEYLNLEGQLLEYNGDYYEYREFSDIPGGGVNYFEKYDLLKKDKVSNYGLESKLGTLLDEKLADESFIKSGSTNVELKGFSDGSVIFYVSASSYDDRIGETDHFIASLNLMSGEFKELSVEPEMDGILNHGVTDSNDLLLEGFQDKYRMVPVSVNIYN